MRWGVMSRFRAHDMVIGARSAFLKPCRKRIESAKLRGRQPEQLPRPANRLGLDPSHLDPLDRPLLLATHDLDAEDRRRADFLLARMDEWLRAAGASRTWLSTPRPNALSTHAYGGTPMGDDPAASVVDRYGEAHDARGLFVLGGSSFPATGGRGPTLTIEALAWRTAARLVAELGRADGSRIDRIGSA